MIVPPRSTGMERSSVPPVRHDCEGGQGLRLMERIVRVRRGTIDLTWTPSGLEMPMTFRTG